MQQLMAHQLLFELQPRLTRLVYWANGPVHLTRVLFFLCKLPLHILSQLHVEGMVHINVACLKPEPYIVLQMLCLLRHFFEIVGVRVERTSHVLSDAPVFVGLVQLEVLINVVAQFSVLIVCVVGASYLQAPERRDEALALVP